MLLALQALNTQAVPSISDIARVVSPYVLAFLSYMQYRSATDRAEMRGEMNGLKERQDKLRNEVTTLNAHVGVDGNGIMAQLVVITQKIDALGTEIAESRGARHVRPGS